MTGKKLAAGWVVQLTLRQLRPDVESDTRPTFQFFNVAISSPDKAIAGAFSWSPVIGSHGRLRAG
jgi:hypothetical protein